MSITLKAKKREETGKKVSALREQGSMPAVLYGHKIDNQNLTIAANEFTKIYQQAGTSTLIDLEIDNQQAIKVIITDTQRDPVQHNIIHTDLYQINMNEEMTADVTLNFVGEAPAVKTLGGVLLKSLEQVQVKCLPGDLPHNITVDLAKLETIDSHITIKDLDIPEKVQVLTDQGETIAVVKEVKVEAEPVVEEKAEGEEGEKKEGEEGEGDKKEGEDEKKDSESEKKDDGKKGEGSKDKK